MEWRELYAEKIANLEAKLAKAADMLRYIEETATDDHAVAKARQALKQIEGVD